MQPHGIAAPDELRDTIHGFWYASIDFTEFPAGFEILPDGFAEIIFHFGSSCGVATAGSVLPLPSPFLMGLLHQPVVLHAAGRVEVIGIKCFPWTVFELLGLPVGNDSVRVFTHSIAQLHPVLAAAVAAGKVAEALALAQQYFLDVRRGTNSDRTLTKAGVALRAGNGTLPVREVAAAAHATVRTLERKFKQAAGRTVKDVSGLIRFEQARNYLWLHPEANLAGLAHELGYTDQAHLSREFKRYSGITPAAFARKAKQSKQLIGDHFVAFLQA